MAKASEVTDRECVLKAISECDELGRDVFLEKHSFARATKYELRHNGRQYDPKALVGVAYSYQFPNRERLYGFGGGAESNNVLTRLGFDVGEITPNSAAPTLDLKAAWRAFQANPIEQCRVHVRRVRALQIQDLFRAGALRDIKTFERDVWKLESETLANGEDWTGWVYSDDLGEAEAEELTEALDNGRVELHGNYIWKDASKKFYPQPGSTDEKRKKSLLALEQVLLDKSLSPQEQVERIISIPGFGPCVATGLAMMFHPTDIAVFASVCPDLAANVGVTAKTAAEYQAFAERLRENLGADDFISLDWFLYRLWQKELSFPDASIQDRADPANHKATMHAPDDLNTILYGPPGTGKTYCTAERAVRIIDGKVPTDREALMRRFSELREAEQIAMVTFHQSYSYEEFVEGIRPVLRDQEELSEGGAPEGVHYECRPGVFRSICERASNLGAQGKKDLKLDLSSIKVWKMSLGNTKLADQEGIFDDCIKHSRIALGYGRQIDFAGKDTFAKVEAHFRKMAGDQPPREFGIQAVDKFKNWMSIGDLVVVSDGNKKFRAIGRITGDYELVDRDDYAQTRAVKWLYKPEESRSRDLILRKDFSQVTLYELRPKVLKSDDLLTLLAQDEHTEATRARPHVLVIDEINRGNIAKILGELMTLLEPDKRIGALNELRVHLPYSGEEFGVPSNLYVIGTMNTADRSIAVLDTALRRRFHFEEMMPDPGVIRREVGHDGTIGGVDVARLLDVLNERVELLYDRDHALGHAFFLKAKSLADLRDVFLRNVIPLLQEYFYDDWEKICQVLGCPYDDESTDNRWPLLNARTLSVSKLLAQNGDYEDKTRYGVNTSFKSAGESELRQYFESIGS